MKAVTLMGMSGAGKTYMSRKLAGWGWYSYCCDLAICRALLGDAEAGMDDTTMVAVFLGKLGNPELGGFDLEKFRARQKMYYDEEVASLRKLESRIARAEQAGFQNFIHDSTGSFCEIEEEEVIDLVGRNSLIVYIKASKEGEKAILQRAQDHPKPLYYPPGKFQEWLDTYLVEKGLKSAEEIVPDEFTRWVFPKLFHARLPKYQRIADKYGITVPYDEFEKVGSEDDFSALLKRYE